MTRTVTALCRMATWERIYDFETYARFEEQQTQYAVPLDEFDVDDRLTTANDVSMDTDVVDESSSSPAYKRQRRHAGKTPKFQRLTRRPSYPPSTASDSNCARHKHDEPPTPVAPSVVVDDGNDEFKIRARNPIVWRSKLTKMNGGDVEDDEEMPAEEDVQRLPRDEWVYATPSKQMMSAQPQRGEHTQRYVPALVMDTTPDDDDDGFLVDLEAVFTPSTIAHIKADAIKYCDDSGDLYILQNVPQFGASPLDGGSSDKI